MPMTVEEKREYQRKWREKNPEKVAEATKKWRKKNPEKVVKAVKKYRKDNPEKVAESVKKWREKNPEKVDFLNVRKQTKKKLGGIEPPQEIVETLALIRKINRKNA